MNNVVDIKLFRPEDLKTLEEAATADQHSGVYAPTHVSWKNGEIVGYLSIGVIPTVLCWQHREKVGPLDSLQLIGFIKGSMQHLKHHLIPCDPESPYNSLLPKAGYIEYTKPVKLYINK